MNHSGANSVTGFPQIRKYRRSLIEVLLASLVLQLLNLAQPWLCSKYLTSNWPAKPRHPLYTRLHSFVGESFSGVDWCGSHLFADTTNRIDITLGAEVIQHLLRLPQRYFDRRPVGELQTRLAELEYS